MVGSVPFNKGPQDVSTRGLRVSLFLLTGYSQFTPDCPTLTTPSVYRRKPSDIKVLRGENLKI